jgi:hypothetical protein
MLNKIEALIVFEKQKRTRHFVTLKKSVVVCRDCYHFKVKDKCVLNKGFIKQSKNENVEGRNKQLSTPKGNSL